MSKTRAAFKLALRYCRQHEDSIKADVFASNLFNHDYNKFWKDIKKTNNDAATVYATTVNGVTGESDIADVWKKTF